MSAQTLELALATFREPSRLSDFRDRPLPEVLEVIKAAAGESATLQAAAQQFDVTQDTMQEAAVFFLQQLLFAPGTDSYRVLGSAADATQDRLRENYRWLMKWLHPDRNQDGWEVVYADRVNAAWQDLKTLDRRAEYDRRAPMAPAPQNFAPRPAPIRSAKASGPILSGSTVRRLPALIFGSLATLAVATLALMYWAHRDNERELARLLVANDGAGQPADGMEPDSAIADELPLTDNDYGRRTNALADPAAVAHAVPADTPVEADPVAIPVRSDVQDASRIANSATVSEPGSSFPAAGTEPGMEAPAIAQSVSKSALADSPPQATDVPAETSLNERVAALEEVNPSVTADASSAQLAVPAAALEPAATAVATADAALVNRRDSKPGQVIAAEPSEASEPVSSRVTLESTGSPAAPAPELKPEPVVVARIPVVRERLDPALQQSVAPPPSAAPTSGPVPRIPDIAAVESPEAGKAAPPTATSVRMTLKEFASAYSAGNRQRFDRLLTGSVANAAPLRAMRDRMAMAEMRFLEIGAVDVAVQEEQVIASVKFRDTYVPSGQKKAVTESGQMRLAFAVDGESTLIVQFSRGGL